MVEHYLSVLLLKELCRSCSRPQ